MPAISVNPCCLLYKCTDGGSSPILALNKRDFLLSLSHKHKQNPCVRAGPLPGFQDLSTVESMNCCWCNKDQILIIPIHHLCKSPLSETVPPFSYEVSMAFIPSCFYSLAPAKHIKRIKRKKNHFSSYLDWLRHSKWVSRGHFNP